MSTGTPEHTPYPNPNVEETNAEDEYSAAEGGFDAGDLWVELEAGDIERRSIWAVITGRRPPPQFSNCASADAAIHELVRTIHPPCGLHMDSSRAYWQLVGEIMESRTFVESFFEGACSSLENLVSDSAFACAQRWVDEHIRHDTLEPAQRFAEQHGDSWQDTLPEGCGSIFEVALLMAGRLDSLRSDDTVEEFSSEFHLYGVFAADTEEFARSLIVDVVNQLPPRRAQAANSPSNEVESHVEGAPPSESPSSSPPERQLRRVWLGPRPEQPEIEPPS